MHTVHQPPDNSPHPPPGVTPYYFRATDWDAIDAAVAEHRRLSA